VRESVELAIRELGAGPPVVILHGLLGSSRNWQAIAKQLGQRYRVVLPDLRNHGASPWSPAMTYPAMAADLELLLDRLGLAEAAVVGHSMGGKAAMTLALTRPERVSRLVVVDIAPVDYGGRGFLDYIAALQALDLDALHRRAKADAALAEAVPDAGVRAFLLQNLGFEGGRPRWQPDLDSLARSMPTITGFPAELAGRRYPGPTLLIRGERTSYVTEDGVAACRALCPGARLLTVRGAGHWVHADAPAIVIGALERFLSG
jgi:esterase